MAYTVLPPIDKKYTARKGLEGPFSFSGRILYYDPKEGMYYDPTTDFYVEQAEMDALNAELCRLIAGNT